MHIGPEIGHQLLNSAERICCLRAAEMPVITIAALIVVANLPHAGRPQNSEYFRPWVDGGTGDGTRQSTISTIAPSS